MFSVLSLFQKYLNVKSCVGLLKFEKSIYDFGKKLFLPKYLKLSLKYYPTCIFLGHPLKIDVNYLQVKIKVDVLFINFKEKEEHYTKKSLIQVFIN